MGEHLRDVLAYEPETGVLTWTCRMARRIRIGDVAGTRNGVGYLVLKVEGRQYQAHRIAWFLSEGSWPDGDLDHINGDRADNRRSNLRLATRSQNCANTISRREGLKGACWVPRLGKWRAKVCKDRQQVHLGYFETEQAAHDAYCVAARAAHGVFARAA